LISEFPELSSLAEEQFNLWGGAGIPSHCFYGNILNSYVADILRENNNRKQIEKIFKFYEKMASSDDEDIRNLLQVTLLEYLWDEETVFKNAIGYMLTETRAINDTISAYLNLPSEV